MIFTRGREKTDVFLRGERHFPEGFHGRHIVIRYCLGTCCWLRQMQLGRRDPPEYSVLIPPRPQPASGAAAKNTSLVCKPGTPRRLILGLVNGVKIIVAGHSNITLEEKT